MRVPFLVAGLYALSVLASITTAHAADGDIVLPNEVRQATVFVQCGNRQGSGTIVSATGMVLTNAHVIADVESGGPITPAASCQVRLIDPTTDRLRYAYDASIARWTFDPTHNQDFALLQIGMPRSREALSGPFPFLKIWEFSTADERLWVLGYPGGGNLTTHTGFIQGFSNGFIRTTATFQPGNSGGTALNGAYNLIGIPTRIVTITEDGQTQEIRYELVDIRAVLQWLDQFSPQERDRFFTFADPERSRRTFAFVEQSTLDCTYTVRAPSSSAVYCLLPGDERLIFPNEATFRSWYPSFDQVTRVPDTALSAFRIVRNVTYRPGTLVKSQTSPETYVVSDAFGTMRHIPSETRAIELWGPNWASLVKDIPDEFFTNYTIGPPLS